MRESTCFVMMPFGGHFDDYYNEIYKPAIEEGFDLLAKRADSIYRPSPILHDIWSLINESTLIIADITGRNPNVMYELGLAHAIAKPVIIISNNIEDVPFDLRALRILLYNTIQPNWGATLKHAINQSIKEVISSPVEAVLPTFLKVRFSQPEEVSETKKDLIEIKQLLYRLNDDDQDLPKTRILNSSDYEHAVKQAHRLYFDDGLDLAEIKSRLMSIYKVGIRTATDIIDVAQRR